MRLWSIHPKYLDAKGLVALWREALLAQKVLAGKTKGYRQHPQLIRFRHHPKPLAAIGKYLQTVYREGSRRKYKFTKNKILVSIGKVAPIKITSGQITFEMKHLIKKLAKRDPIRAKAASKTMKIVSHPFFKIIRGHKASWEK
jgi:hypothetical protein